MTDRLDRLTDTAEDWIDRVLSDGRALKGFCWGVITIAVIYFAPVLIGILIR